MYNEVYMDSFRYRKTAQVHRGVAEGDRCVALDVDTGHPSLYALISAGEAAQQAAVVEIDGIGRVRNTVQGA